MPFLYIVIKRSLAASVLLAILSLGLLSGCSAQDKSSGANDGSAQVKGEQKSDEGKGGVTVFASFEGSSSDALEVSIKLDTHTVDLTSFEIQKNIYLTDENGVRATAGSVKTEGDSHHKEITALFNRENLDMGQGKDLTLVLTNLAGEKEREISWEMP